MDKIIIMKIILTMLLIVAASNVKAQLKSSERTEVINMINTIVNPLKTEIKWLRTGKTADSLALVKTNATVVTLRDSLNKFKPIVFPDARVVNGLKIDTVYTKPQ